MNVIMAGSWKHLGSLEACSICIGPSGGNMSDDEKKTQELYKKVRGVLNKLTPQKFDTLLIQVKAIAIDTKERLQGVVDLIFEKAVDEPNLSVGYALMCRELALMQVPVNNNEKKETVNFRKLLVTRCQLEFEKNSVDQNLRNAKLKEIEECTDTERKKELQVALEEDDRRIRMKSVGNIRFIGELFKQEMLTVNIMMRCLLHLIDNKEEASLESLCILLLTVGKEVEEKKVDLNPIFTTIREIVDKKHGKVSSRVRFMLLDVIDLRNSKWIPRCQNLNPKTIDQIQDEVNREQLTIQQQRQHIPKSNPPAVPKPRPPPADRITPEQLERKIKNILEEYLNDCCTIEDCENDIRTNIPPTALAKFVSDSYINVLERSETARIKTGNLFAHLIKRRTLLIDNYCIGLEEVLSQAEDLTIDIPKIWDYLAKIIVPIICENVVSLARLHRSFDILIRQGHATKLLDPLFKLVITAKGPKYLHSLWISSGLALSNFMPAAQVNGFVQDNQLDFLVGGTNVVLTDAELTYEQIHEKLLEFFANKNTPEDILLWIKANIKERMKEKQFVRTLATAVFEDSIDKHKLKLKTLRSHYNLLIRIADAKLEYEVECLYALQALINKLEHPQGLLLQIYSNLYDDNIFYHDCFVKWELSENPAEQEGKGVALEQLTSFFTRLKEADEETSSTKEA